MQPNKLESTTNYDRFVFKKGNRPVRARVASLMDAMKKHNQLQEYPILVSELRDGKLEIADGQHRFTAAKSLGFPIFFIRSRQRITIEQIAHANTLQKSWSMRDWLDSWVDQDKPHYITLKNFITTFQLPITVGMEVLGGAYGGQQNADFKAGTFECKETKFGQIVGHTLGALRGHVPVSDLRLVRAIVRVLRVPGISIDRLIKKLSKHSHMFERQATWAKYVQMIEQLYNKQVGVGDRVSLAFQVDQMERERRSEKTAKGNATKARMRGIAK